MKIDKLVRNLIGTEKLGRGNEFAHFNPSGHCKACHHRDPGCGRFTMKTVMELAFRSAPRATTRRSELSGFTTSHATTLSVRSGAFSSSPILSNGISLPGRRDPRM